MKQRRKKLRVIPGFGLSLGITVAILSFIVIIPLCSLVVFSAHLSLSDFIQTVTSPRVLASYKVSFLTALTASLINAVMGLIVAWVLVRYEFPGKRIIDGMIAVSYTHLSRDSARQTWSQPDRLPTSGNKPDLPAYRKRYRQPCW